MKNQNTKKIISLLQASFAVLCVATMASAATPTLSRGGTTYSLDWDSETRISATFAVQINGKWVFGEAFPTHEWSEANGWQSLRCSGLAPIESFELSVETVEGRPYAVVKASLAAASEFELGGVRLLTKKGDAQNVSVGKTSDGWNVFVEALRAPDYGRIYWLDQLDELTPGRKDDPRDAFWVSTLQNDASNRTLAFAALKGELWPTVFEWRNVAGGQAHLSIRSGSPKGLEKIVVPAGKTITVDPVLIGCWSDRRPTQALAEVGRIMGESVRQGRPMRMIEPGWSTWHSYTRTITAEAMLSAARL